MTGNNNSGLTQSLPVEIQSDIIQELDPISLIALSQTCSHFRRVISPGRRERLEQLLQLEGLAKYGGEVEYYGTSLSYTRMSYERDFREWESFRWACSACLKLLPHEHFANKTIFRVTHRKPHPRFLATSPRTTWGGTNGETIGSGLVFKTIDGSGSAAEWPNTGADNCMSTEQELEDEQGTQLPEWGRGRHLRECIPCLYAENEPPSKVHPFPLGDDRTLVTIPIVRSRNVVTFSLLDRFFPGFLDSLTQEGEAPQSERVWRYRDQFPIHFRPARFAFIQCSTCKKWKELRSMHVRGGVPWNGNDETQSNMYSRLMVLEDHKDKGICCTDCFVRDYGREALRDVLVPWFSAHIYLERMLEWERMRMGWGFYGFARGVDKISGSLREDLESRLKEVGEITEGMSSYLDVTPEVDKRLRAQYEKALPMLKAVLKVCEDNNLWYDQEFRPWLNGYRDMDDQRNWLESAKNMVEKDPDLILDWVLNRDSHPFNLRYKTE